MAALAGSTSTNVLPGRGLINPAFVIKIVKADDDMQQKESPGRDNPNDDYMSNLAAGDIVDAKYNGKTINGSVKSVIKNSIGDVIFVMITDRNGKSYKVDSSAVSPSNFGTSKDPDDDALVSSPAVHESGRFMSFSNFNNI
jgi:hypothetical protein